MSPLSSFSLIKCLSTSLCLVWSRRTWFLAISIANLLSQKGLIELTYGIRKSARMPLIYNASYMPWAVTWNSASALDLASTDCFLLFLRSLVKILMRGRMKQIMVMISAVNICALLFFLNFDTRNLDSASMFPWFESSHLRHTWKIVERPWLNE